MKALNWKWIGRVIAPAIAILLVAVRASANEVSFETIALTGQPAAGAGPGAYYAAFDVPFINNVGLVSFHARLAGPAVQVDVNDYGIWIGEPGNVGLLARRGDPAPGTTGDIYYYFATPILNDVNQFVFHVILNQAGGDTAYYFGTPGDFSLMIHEGDPAPGTPAGYTFGHNLSFLPFLNDDGRLAFRAELAGPGVDPDDEHSVWTGTPDALSLVARTGAPAPGTAEGVVFGHGGVGSCFEGYISLDDSGQVAFRAKLEGPGIWAPNDAGIWTGPPDALALVVREGDPAPGTGDYITFEDMNDREFFNGAGEILFRSFVTGPGVNVTNNLGLWVGPPGAISLLARMGDQAPGLPAGVVFGLLDRGPLDAAGQTAFMSYLRGTGVNDSNDSALFFGTPGALSLIIREGDQVPEAAAGVVFAGFDEERMLFNCSGQIVFMSDLTGPGVDETNNRAIMTWDSQNGLRQVVRTGDSFEVAPGDTRTVSLLYHLTTMLTARGCDENAPTSFNDQGQLAFFASFVDGSGSGGIFVATLGQDLPGDIDGDGDVDEVDQGLFIEVLLGIDTGDPVHVDRSDLNGSGTADGGDVQPFVEVRLGN